jgi:hypothetical protein
MIATVSTAADVESLQGGRTRALRITAATALGKATPDFAQLGE